MFTVLEIGDFKVQNFIAISITIFSARGGKTTHSETFFLKILAVRSFLRARGKKISQIFVIFHFLRGSVIFPFSVAILKDF